MLNKVGAEKIPHPQIYLLLRFAVYRDSYLDTNPKMGYITIQFSEAIPTPNLQRKKYNIRDFHMPDFGPNIGPFPIKK